jgi:hypothetical protein
VTQPDSARQFWHVARGKRKRDREEAPASVLASAAGDVHVIEVTDMSNPVQATQYGVEAAGGHNVWMDEQSGILYAAFYYGGVRVLDVPGDLDICDASYRNVRGSCDLRRMGRDASPLLSRLTP